MAEEKVRKTTAKKAVRRTTTKVAPRKTPVRRTTASVTPAASASSPARKAPARTVVSVPVSKRSNKKKLIVVLVLFLAVLSASFAIGMSDQGQIDVGSIIATRKQNATPEERQTFETIPVQQTQTNVVNGGLVGSHDQTQQSAPEVEEVASLATSTESSATTTETLLPEETQQEEATEPEAAPEETITEEVTQ